MSTPISVAILGAGQEGTDLLTSLLPVPGIEVVVVGDRDPNASGFQIAKAAGVLTTTDPIRSPAIGLADIILDAGNDAQALSMVSRHKAPAATLINGAALQLFRLVVTHYRQAHGQGHQAERMTEMANLLAAAAHELNNPLCVITGFSALASAHAQAKDWHQVCDDVHAIAVAADRLRALVKRFLEFARPAWTSDMVCDVNGCLREVLSMLEPDLRRLDILIESSLAASLPPVLADPQTLQDVFVNLLTNARDAMVEAQQGHVISCDTAVVEATQVRIRIRDNGPGIPPIHLPHIFEPLYTTKRPGRGTGLGLSICHGIITALGGTILCESEPGQGARFTICVPAAPS